MKLLILITLFLSTAAFAQDLPNLSDTILILKKEKSNYYYLNADTSQVDTFYYDNNVIHAKGRHVKNKRNGNWLVYYPSGAIKTVGYVIDSSFYGKWQFYYTNGNLKAKGKFKYTPDDSDSSTLVLKMSGKWRFWNDDGKLIAKKYFSPYRAEKESKYGKQSERYENGSIKSKGEYHKGVKIGKWTYYHENGHLEKIEYYTYKLNIDNTYTYPVGMWMYYNNEGKVIKKVIYKEGQIKEEINVDN